MKSFAITLAVLCLATSLYADGPPDKITTKIKVYVSALSHPNTMVRKNALKELNDLKALYPNLSIKEYDNFLTSEIMKNVTKDWKTALTSDNEGVRHSALHHLVRFKSDFPSMDMSLFNNILDKIRKNDSYKHIRVDATIAHVYINDSEIASRISVEEEIAPGDVFTQIHLDMDNAFHERDKASMKSDMEKMYPSYNKNASDTNPSKILKKVTNAWKTALTSSSPAVRHDALHHLVRFKSDFPAADMSFFNSILNNMIKTDAFKHNRVDATIAHVYINDSKIASQLKVKDKVESGDIFTQIHLDMDKAFHDRDESKVAVD